MVNVFSFCIYGVECAKYHGGLLENIRIIEGYFPDWKVYVYYGSDTTESMITKLASHACVVLRPTNALGPINMIHRFYAIDELNVDIMMVRDADSRVHWKDRWAIREFVRQPHYIAHTIRDHVEHTAHMMGGLWGLRKSAGIHMGNEYKCYNEDSSLGHRNGHDQNFLADAVYPKVVSRMLVHYSNNRRRIGENAVEFPFVWKNDVYCGRVEEDFEDIHEPRQKPLTFINFLHRR